MLSKLLSPIPSDMKRLEVRLNRVKSNLEIKFNDRLPDLLGTFASISEVESYLNNSLRSHIRPEIKVASAKLREIEDLRSYPTPIKYLYDLTKYSIVAGLINHSIQDPSFTNILLTSALGGFSLLESIYFPVLTERSKLAKLEALVWYIDRLASMRVKLINERDHSLQLDYDPKGVTAKIVCVHNQLSYNIQF